MATVLTGLLLRGEKYNIKELVGTNKRDRGDSGERKRGKVRKKRGDKHGRDSERHRGTFSVFIDTFHRMVSK